MSQPSEQHKDPSLQFEVELHDDDAYEKEELGLPADVSPAVPSICGMPLKYVSYVVLLLHVTPEVAVLNPIRLSLPLVL